MFGWHFLARFPLLLAAALVILGAGCGKREAPLYPVQGKIMIGNMPLTKGKIGLHPDASEGNSFHGVPWGELDSAGNYKVTFQGQAGAPLGVYKVTVTPPDDLQGPMPNRKYRKKEDTDLKIVVTETPASDAYDLKVQP